jgi:hypothetical protein
VHIINSCLELLKQDRAALLSAAAALSDAAKQPSASLQFLAGLASFYSACALYVTCGVLKVGLTMSYDGLLNTDINS